MGVSLTKFFKLKKQDKKEKIFDHLLIANENLDVIDSAINDRAKTSDLSAVATSGSYNDLNGKPTILNGREIEIITDNNYIKWRYIGDKGWNNLIPLSQLTGFDGKSAYEIAVENGFQGSMQQWIQSLIGKSAYEVAVELGFVGTKAEWESSLHGDYFHIKYSNLYPERDSDMYDDPSGHSPKYMGVATTKSQVPPTIFSSYKWSKISGENGAQGIPGAAGTNQYLHIKYSDDGLTFTLNNGETLGKWIGTRVDEIQQDSSKFNDYSWKKFVGEDGESSYTFVRYSEHPDGADMVSTYLKGVTIFKGILVINASNSPDINNPSKYTWALFEATDGEDAVVVSLTNENTSLTADSNGYVADYSAAITTIEVYDGAKKVALAETNISVQTHFITGLLSGFNYQVNALTSNVGYVDFAIKYKNIIYNRRFTIVKNKPGTDGKNGLDGVSPLSLEIFSSNGNIFKNGDIATTLRAKVYRGEANVTDDFNDNAFIWTRFSGNIETDTVWNQTHFSGNKAVIITKEDIQKKATFFCDLIDTSTRNSLL
ncbi:MAG: hypothetical protein RR370_01925 [Synergistaceae bacterium]